MEQIFLFSERFILVYYAMYLGLLILFCYEMAFGSDRSDGSGGRILFFVAR